MNISEYLQRDHQRLNRLLSAAIAGDSLDLETFEAFRGGLLRHIAIEEKILLREVRRSLGDLPHPDAHRLRVEHGALTSLMVPTPTRPLVLEVLELLRIHDQREEGPDGVYATCITALGPEVSDELATRAEGYPSVPLMGHYDGPNVCRTAAEALASAERMAPPKPRSSR